MNMLAITQVGDKKDRKYFVKQAFTDLNQIFVVQGIGANFFIFANDKQSAKFKTFKNCQNYIANL